MLERLCKDQGAILVDIEIPELFENGKAHNITICAEMLSKVHVGATDSLRCKSEPPAVLEVYVRKVTNSVLSINTHHSPIVKS